MAYRIREAWIGVFLCVLAVIPLGGQTPAQVTPTGITIEGVVVDRDQGAVPGARVTLKHSTETSERQAVTDSAGKFRFANVPGGQCIIRAELRGFKTTELSLNVPARTGTLPIRIPLELGGITETVQVVGGSELIRTETPTVNQTVSTQFIQNLPRGDRNVLNYLVFLPGADATQVRSVTRDGNRVTMVPPGTETYARFRSNRFQFTLEDPLSTFAADVDTASYTNVRRFLRNGQLPPANAVRVEEMVNYFRFAYPAPSRNRPVSVTAEIGECPWAPGHKLALIGVRARDIDSRTVTGRNIVLLIDVSGSMQSPDKLPLVQTALRMFVDTLRPADRLAIVTYAGSSGVALPSTPASDRARIHHAIAALTAGGSTNGAEGLVLAYRIARQHFVDGGVNRVILATDGDFNVGVTSQGELHALIARERESGVFLSVLGVGTGNLKDQTMEMLADRGNGHYAYLDSLQEARRVLVREGGATLETVAKDVKFQVEFNPMQVAAWRLIGYETRLLAHQDFNDDRKDGGELGAGHTVTVLYEIVPPEALNADPNVEDDRPAVDPLRYQEQPPVPVRTSTRGTAVARAAASTTQGSIAEEIFTVKVRYKRPDADVSNLMTVPVRGRDTPRHLPFAALVAEFGMLLRDPQSAEGRWAQLSRRLEALAWSGENVADRRDFVELVDLAAGLRGLGR